MPTTNITTYGDISPRTAAYAAKEMLKRAEPLLVLEKFGQARPLPKNSSTTIKFRRYEALDPTPMPLTEGVTPAGKKLTVTDVQATLQQFGDYVTITDVVQDTHEDPVLREAMAVTGEQAAQMYELVRYGVLNGGTNVFYAGGVTDRASVASGFTLNLQRQVTAALRRQNARQITSIVSASPNFGTSAIPSSYIAVCHVDLDATLRDTKGFVSVENYGSDMQAMPGEIGSIEGVRYIGTTLAMPYSGAGTGTADDWMSADGAKPDVYPILYFAKDAYGLVPLKGMNAVRPCVLNPNTPRGGDPLGQRGSVGWKGYTTAVILNDLWMARAEVLVNAKFE